MSKDTVAQRLLQIVNTISNRECHRATCALMDFTRDFTIEEKDLSDTVGLRKLYNSYRQLGKTDITEEQTAEILLKASEIYQRVSAYSYDTLEEAMLQSYPQQPLLTASTIVKIYPRQSRFKLGPVSTVLKAGEITGIVGENGNGKTTLLRILARLLDYDTGHVTFQFDGAILQEDYAIKHSIAYIPQQLEGWQGTLRENLHYAATIHGIHGDENDKAVEFVIHRMGLSNFAHLGWKELSSGYKLRFELAKTLVWSPKILILDEPLANLDINAQEWLLQDFKSMASSLRNPVSIIMSSQQLHEVEHVADNIIFLRNGQCEYSGAMNNFMQEREGNVFELSGDFILNDLKILFNTDGFQFTESGLTIVLRTERLVSSSDILSRIISSGYAVKYFRDISTSTKQLFQL